MEGAGLHPAYFIKIIILFYGVVSGNIHSSIIKYLTLFTSRVF